MTSFLSIILYFSSTGAHLRDKAKKIYIGSAISPDHFAKDTQYKTVAAQEFNCATAEWQMKWQPIEDQRGHPIYTAADQFMQFAKQSNMKVRAHALLWHLALPKWVEALANNKDELHKVMVKHIT